MAADKWGEITPLREVCLPSAALAIDESAGVIRGVRVLGRKSLNGREYTEQAVRKGRDMYEGRPVNVDHFEKGGTKDGQRSVASRFGWLENIHEANDGLEGDLHYLKAHSLAPQIIETAKRNPRMFGMSHVADGRTSRRDGKVFVEEIIGVRSVDLVADPATTKSLFESMENPMDMSTDTNAAAAAPTGNVTDMIVGKVRDILSGDGDPQAKAKQIGTVVKELLKIEDKIDAAMAGDAAKKPDGDSSAAPTKESKDMDALNAILKETRDRLAAMETKANLLESQNAARAMLVEAKVEVTDVRIAAVVAAATPEAKKALVESWPVQTLTEAVKPRSAGKPISEGWTPPKDAKETAKRLKSSLRR